MKKCMVMVLLCCLLSAAGHAQTAYEEFLEQMAGEADVSLSLEELEELRQHPLDINRASVAQLQRIPLVTPVLAARIVALRRQRGGFQSLQNLVEVQDMSDDFLHYLSHFIVVTTAPAKRPWRLELRSRAAGSCTPAEVDGPLLTSMKTYARLSLEYGERVHIGAVLEKDAGERKLDDYRGAFLTALLPKLRTRVLLGSYTLTFGQGLLLWGAYGYGRGADPILPARRSASPLKPYASVDENAGLQGVAFESVIASFSICAFLSHTSLDATVSQSGKVSSLYTAGLHRTASEQAKKDMLGETLHGGRIAWRRNDWLHLAVAYYASTFSIEMMNPDSVRNRFAFRGRHNRGWSIEGDVTVSKFNIFAEVARCEGGGMARAGGVLFDCSPVRVILHLRDYDRDYYNTHAQAFSHGSGDVKNERGVYTGMSWKLHRTLRLAMYHEIYHHPWRTYLYPLSSAGEESFIQGDYSPGRDLLISLRVKCARTQSLIKGVDEHGRERQSTTCCRNVKIRGQLTWQATPSITLVMRFEKCLFSETAVGNLARYHVRKSSLLLYQGAQLRFNEHLSSHLRVTFFDAGDYDTRLYAYENDLPGVARSRCFIGRGTHWYVVCHYRLKRLSFGIKYASTCYENETQGRARGAEITGVTDYSISAQCDLAWR